MDTKEKALWEIKNEKNKTGVRWLIIAVLGAYLGTRFTDAPYIFYLLGAATIWNSLVTLYLHRAAKAEQISRWAKYVTMASDFLLVALILVPTGGSSSLLYPINYVVIVSNALRYGMGVALAGTFLMNIFYLGVLAHQYYPEFVIPGFHQEVLKVGAFWLVGIYTGYLSRRFTILRGEVERLQVLLSKALEKK